MRTEGLSFKEIRARTGRSTTTVQAVVRQHRVVAAWAPGPGRLSMAEREEIRLGVDRGEALRSIAARLGRARSTVSRELKANGGPGGYRAWKAHGAAATRARRPKLAKLVACPALGALVAEWLSELWSPDEIARRLRAEFPNDPMMWVSHETIYQSLYVQGRGALRKELAACLRSGRAHRRPRSQAPRRQGRIADMVKISERPAEVADRAVPGHWEGDLIIGKDSKSAVGTLVERSTRYVLLLHLDDARAETVNEAMRLAIAKLPGEMFRTITWDQGKEMARHADFTIATGIQIYFCDPHSPWQRGSNENTNGLLRQYMPKGTDLSVHTQADLDRFGRSLNNRPRKTLGYLKPSERLAQVVAMTG